MYNWENGKNVCFDVIGVSPFTSARIRSFTPGQAITAAVIRKKHKYLDMCISNGYGLGVLAFITFGELSEAFIVFLKRLSNCLSSYNVNYKVGSLFFHMLGVIIQNGFGAQIIARLPTITV